uniref:Small-subunit processome Utp12 domain-containing protein n=1 Tax=Brassica oleracea var. oleracea TaxID=109376 RepID=A0A0D3CAH5_BRAOL
MAKEKLKPLPTSDGGEIAEKKKHKKKKNRKRAEPDPDPDVPSTREPRDSGVDEDRDGGVIANSVAKLNSAEVLKLLNSLLPILQSRGAVLACAIPWIKCLLLTHSSGIMSQESSVLALNSMYQLIESRVSTLHTAVEVSSSLDLLVDDLDDEEEEDEGPLIYEDKDTDDEEGQGPDEAMETDEDADESEDEAADGVNEFEDFDDMSD